MSRSLEQHLFIPAVQQQHKWAVDLYETIVLCSACPDSPTHLFTFYTVMMKLEEIMELFFFPLQSLKVCVVQSSAVLSQNFVDALFIAVTAADVLGLCFLHLHTLRTK